MSDVEARKDGTGVPSDVSVRPVPAWVWVIGAVFFPMGTFVVLGIARALRWRVALPLAIVSYGMVLLFPAGQHFLRNEPMLSDTYVSMAFLLFMCAAGQLQYAIGVRCGLWTHGARRAWRIAAYFAVAFLVVVVLQAVGLIVLAGCYGHMTR